MHLRRPSPARTAGWVVGVCLLALLVLGVLGARVMPRWGSSCPDGGGCDLAGLRSLVLTAWAVHGLALAGLAGGMVAVGRTRPRSPVGEGITDEHAASPARHAMLAAGFVAVTDAITAAALGLAMIFGGLMVGAVVAAWWVGLTVFLDALDRLSRPASERRGSWWRALATSTATVATLWVVPVLVVGVERRGWSEAFLVSDVLVAGVAGLATLWSRLAPGGAAEPAMERRRAHVAAALGGTVLLPLALVVSTDLGSRTWVRSGELLGDLLNPYPAEVAEAPSTATSPTATASSTDASAGAAAPACEAADLSATVTAGEHDLSARTVRITLRHTGRRACLVGGYPDLRLAGAGPPLLTIRSDHAFDGTPVEPPAPAEVTLDPGGSASSLAWWRPLKPRTDDEQGTRDGTGDLVVVLELDGQERDIPTTVTGADDPALGLRAGSRVRLEPWS